MKYKWVLILAFFLAPVLCLQAATYNIRDFGAQGDSKTLNTQAIQKAIDSCRSSGGGTVLIPAGIYLSGTLQLYSNIELHLEQGAVLKGSPKVRDYFLNGNKVGLLYTENAENISLSGPGNIDGNGDVFMDLNKAKTMPAEGLKYTRQKEHFREVLQGLGDGPVVPLDRPFQMIIFSNCKNVSVRNLLISNSPFWTVHFADCDGVIVSGIKLWNNLMVANGDGLDFTSCRNVMISECDIRAGDDAIVLAGYDHHFDLPGYKRLKHPSENITVTNCTLQSRSSGIRIGGADQNSMRNYVFSNLVIDGSNRGIGVFLRDKGSIEDVIFNNIIIKCRLHTGDWWGNGEPIHISAVRNTEEVTLGKIHNLKFSHIFAEGESGMLIYGTPESVIENLTFHDVSFHLKESPLNPIAGGNFDLRPVLDNKLQLFSHNMPAIYAQYVKGLEIHDFNLTWDDMQESYFTCGLEVDHFENVLIQGFHGGPAPSNKTAKAINLKAGKNYKIIESDSGVVDKSQSPVRKKN
jgi:hypothetical protein